VEVGSLFQANKAFATVLVTIKGIPVKVGHLIIILNGVRNKREGVYTYMIRLP
jgi:hypothetical protein